MALVSYFLFIDFHGRAINDVMERVEVLIALRTAPEAPSGGRFQKC